MTNHRDKLAPYILHRSTEVAKFFRKVMDYSPQDCG